MSTPTFDAPDAFAGVADDSETHGTDVAVLEQRLKGLEGTAKTLVSTLPADTFEDKLANMQILTNSVALVDQGALTINLANVIVQTITMEGQAVPRVVLVDDNGQGYHAISAPILGSIETLFGMVGHPRTWPMAIPTRLEKVRAKNGTAFTLKFGAEGE